MSNEKFTAKIQSILQDAARLAASLSHGYVTVETLLAATLPDQEVKDIIEHVGGDYNKLVNDVNEYLQTEGNIPAAQYSHGSAQPLPPRETSFVVSILQTTVARARASGKQEILPRDLFITILDAENSHAAYFIGKNGVKSLAVKEYVSHGGAMSDDDSDYEEDSMIMTPMGPMPASGSQARGPMTEKKALKILNKYLTNLNIEAEKGRIDPLIGREYEVNELIKILARRKKNNPILRGEAGVGKTAIPEGLARIINEVTKAKLNTTLENNYPNFPEFLVGATIWNLEIGSLIAGTKFRGEFEEKLKDVINAIVFLNNELNQTNILFIDEIHTALGAGATSGSSLDAGNILKPALTKGTLRTIGSTTFDEYKKYVEKDRALARRFRPIDVHEPSDEDCFKILNGLRNYYESHHGVSFTDDALEAAIRLTKRYIFNSYLPDKAIDAIDSAGATQQILPESEKTKIITEKQIQAEVARMARIPDDEATKNDAERLNDLAGQLRSVVFGQEAAITALENSVYLSMAGLRPHNKTRGAYLFGGPTGVGKTEVAKKLSQILGIELHRFNMSEYMEKHTVSRLIGAPPGYVGFDSAGGAGSGLLTDAVDKQPHSIVLLDEVDKAHPDIFNILLQVMDDGKLTNSVGKTVDFKNVILIMTTNAGASDSSRRSIGIARELSGFDDTKQMEAIDKFFTPEFRNRLDGTIIFDRLSPKVMLSIVDKFIGELNILSSEKKVTFVIDESAKTWLAREGYDPLYGARPLSRVIQNEISIPVSRQMLFGKLKNGGIVKLSTEKTTEVINNIERNFEKISIKYESLD